MCPGDCLTPETPYVNWELSDCPQPGKPWDEAMVADGCKLNCAADDQYMPMQCKEGAVAPVDTEVKPCLPAQWQPDDGPCSASCGAGTFVRQWYCASENNRDEDCDQPSQWAHTAAAAAAAALPLPLFCHCAAAALPLRRPTAATGLPPLPALPSCRREPPRA